MSNLRYDEKDEKLTKRLDLHNQVAEKDIDVWILDIIKPQEGSSILDIGCGTGKQLLMFGKALENYTLTGVDINSEILETTRQKVSEAGVNATIKHHDMNHDLPFEDNTFDIITSCFAIYYVDNPRKILSEIQRVLKPSGKVFIAGPSPKNAIEFWDLCSEVAKKPTPETCIRRKDRLHDDFIPIIKELFADVRVETFENFMHFKTTKEVVDYYAASLLFTETKESEEEGQEILENLTEAIEKIVQQDGEYKIRKEVYGILGVKK